MSRAKTRSLRLAARVLPRGSVVWSHWRRRLALRLPYLSAEGAALSRVVLGAVLLWLTYHRFSLDVNAVPANVIEASRGYGLGQFAFARYLIVDAALISVLYKSLYVLLACFMLGLATRLVSAGIWLCLAWLVCAKLTISGGHDWATPLIALLALPMGTWSDAWSLDAGLRRLRKQPRPVRNRAFGLWWVGLTLGVAYAAAAYAKLEASGFEWVTSGAVGYHCVEDFRNANSDWGIWIAGHHWAAVLASAMGLGIEAGFISIVFVRNPWLRLGIALLGLSLHVGFYFFQGLLWAPWLFLYLAFLPYEPAAQLLRAMGRRVRRMATWLFRKSTRLVSSIHTCAPAESPRVTIRPWQTSIVATLLGIQVVATSTKLEYEPFFSFFPMYSHTHSSWADFFDRARWSKYQRYHFSATDAQGNEVDLTLAADALGASVHGPLMEALEWAARGKELEPKLQVRVAEALQSLEKEHGQPLHTLIYRVDQEAIDFQQREFCWRFQNRYAATLDVATLRFLDLDEGFCNAHIPGPDEAARN